MAGERGEREEAEVDDAEDRPGNAMVNPAVVDEVSILLTKSPLRIQYEYEYEGRREGRRR